MLHQLLLKLYRNPKTLFLIDGIGAFLSAFMLGIVLVHHSSYLGISIPKLQLLSLIPSLFMLYDFYCYFKIKTRISLALRGIAFANLAYSLCSFILIYMEENVSLWAWAYIILEIMIIVPLAMLELRVASQNKFS